MRTRGGHGGNGQAVALPGAAQEGVGPVGDFADKAAADDRRRLWHSSPAKPHRRERVLRHECSTCSLSFDRKKQLEEHLAGKRHRQAVEAADAHWAAFQRSSWREPSLTDAEHEDVVRRAWSLDEFVSGLPSRSRADGSGIAPHVTLSSLAPRKRLQIWRYLRELMPSRPELPEAFSELERRYGRFARVKEILESGETFLHAEQAILRSDPTAVVSRGRVAFRPGRIAHTRLRRVVDVACGHGLVGLLLAYRFPELEVIGIDRTERPAHAAYVDSWRTAHRNADASATAAEPLGEPLGNVRFIEAELRTLLGEESGGPVDGALAGPGLAESSSEGGDGSPGAAALADGSTLVLCVHGCNEVNVEAVEMATRCGASWLIVPCCLRAGLYLRLESMRLADETNYAFLCGAMAASYGAERVATLDPRITPKSIVLSADGSAGPGKQGRGKEEEAARLTARGKVASLPSVRGRERHIND